MTIKKLFFYSIISITPLFSGCMIHSHNWQASTAMDGCESNVTECRFNHDNPFFGQYECYLRESNNELQKLPMKHS